MTDKQALRRARWRAAAKLSFYVHFVVYLLVNLMLLGINVRTTPGRWWFVWPLFGWGIGIACHGVVVFLGTSVMQQMTERELKNDDRR